jgi:hypothetical protein
MPIPKPSTRLKMGCQAMSYFAFSKIRGAIYGLACTSRLAHSRAEEQRVGTALQVCSTGFRMPKDFRTRLTGPLGFLSHSARTAWASSGSNALLPGRRSGDRRQCHRAHHPQCSGGAKQLGVLWQRPRRPHSCGAAQFHGILPAHRHASAARAASSLTSAVKPGEESSIVSLAPRARHCKK